MHAKIEKLLNMLKAQEHNSSETFDFISQLIQKLLKEEKSAQVSSVWIIK
jgi:hypothetical protein